MTFLIPRKKSFWQKKPGGLLDIRYDNWVANEIGILIPLDGSLQVHGSLATTDTELLSSGTDTTYLEWVDDGIANIAYDGTYADGMGMSTALPIEWNVTERVVGFQVRSVEGSAYPAGKINFGIADRSQADTSIDGAYNFLTVVEGDIKSELGNSAKIYTGAFIRDGNPHTYVEHVTTVGGVKTGTLFVDGKQFGTVTHTNSIHDYSALIALGCGSNNHNRGLQGVMNSAFYVDHRVPIDLAQALSEAPYQIVKPRKTFSFVTAGGGATPKTLTTSLSAAVEKQGILKTTSLEAAIQKAFSLNTSLEAGLAKVFTLDTDLAATLQKKITLITDLEGGLQKTLTLDTNLEGAVSKAFTLDTNLAGTLAKTFTLDTNLEATLQKNLTLDTNLAGTLQKTLNLTTLLEGALQKELSLTTSLEGYLASSGALTLITSLEGALQKEILLTLSLEGAFAKEITLTTDLVGTLSKVATLTVSLLGALQKTISLGTTLEGALQIGQTLSLNLSGSLEKTLTLTTSLAGYLELGTFINTLLAGALQKAFNKTVSLEAYIQTASGIWTPEGNGAGSWIADSGGAGNWTPESDLSNTWS